MTIVNGSFESAGGALGQAASWSWSTSTTAAHIASYGGSRFERFELGWGVDSPALDIVVPTNAAAALYNAPATPQTFDNFERGWSGNETFQEMLSSAAAGTTDTFDSWVAAPIFIFSGGDLDAPAAETFESGWFTGFLATFAPGDLSAAIFAPGSVAFEDFESTREDHLFTIDTSTGVITTPTPHPYAVFDIVHFTNDGTGYLPAGLSPELDYVVASTPSPNTLTVYANGVLAVPTDQGSGVNKIKADNAVFWTDFI